METIIKGGNLMLFLGESSESIPLATSHTMRISSDTVDVSNKDVASGKWAATEIGKFSWEVTTDNLYSDTAVEDLYEYMLAAEPIDALFFQKDEDDDDDLPAGGSWTPSSTAKGFAGQVLITSLDLTAQNGENATFSASFTGYGELKWGTLATLFPTTTSESSGTGT